jgi:hypothetical protein
MALVRFPVTAKISPMCSTVLPPTQEVKSRDRYRMANLKVV